MKRFEMTFTRTLTQTGKAYIEAENEDDAWEAGLDRLDADNVEWDEDSLQESGEAEPENIKEMNGAKA